MERNVGGYDRIVRYVLGAVLFVAGVGGFAGVVTLAAGPVSPTVGAAIALVIGLVMLVTGYTQKCPMHRALGFNTLRGS